MNKLVSEVRARLEKATKGPWKNGIWSGVCRIPEHKGNHPGPPYCKYEPTFYEMKWDESGVRFAGIVSVEAGVSIIEINYESLTMKPCDAELIAHAPADLAALVLQVEAAEKMAEALEKLPLDSFDAEDMGKSDAADFTDHAGEFFEAMQAARAALAHWEEVTHG